MRTAQTYGATEVARSDRENASGLAKRASQGEACYEAGVSGAAPYRRTSLRNAAINYRAGWWAVTMSVAKNKSLLGAIVGEEVRLNALGRFVEETWRSLPARYPELELFDFVVMPNHFHALLRIHSSPTNREHHLGFLVGRFKGATSHRYGEMRRVGEIEDIGDSLWQRDYWDDLVTSEAEFAGWQHYIRENPKNWSRDRYGACTTYSRGDVALLNAPRVAFVASAGFSSAALRPRRLRAALAAPCEAKVLISTFTSPQEREALRRALAKKKRLIAVFPAGIPATLSPALDAAIREGRALAVSPQPPDSRLNKKIATWCNEFVLRNADEIWVGDIAPNGMLAQMLSGLSVCASMGATKVAPSDKVEAGNADNAAVDNAAVDNVDNAAVDNAAVDNADNAAVDNADNADNVEVRGLTDNLSKGAASAAPNALK